MDLQSQLSRRERQIMDIVYAHGKVTGNDILRELPDAPARGALRVMLRSLENKGHLRHVQEGRQFIYRPTVPVQKAGPSAMRRVVDTFFGGSLRQAVAAHLAQKDTDISSEELKRLGDLIRQARAKGR